MKGRSLEEINTMFQNGVAVREFGMYPKASPEAEEEDKIGQSGQ